MTRIDRSPEQLDAEAAVRSFLNRSHPRDPLTAWRAAAHHEAPSKMHQKPTAEMGVDLAEQLARYIDGSAGHFPVHDALLRWDHQCRQRHQRWPDHRGRPVCAEIAWMVLRDQCSLQFAADQTGVTWTRAERLLLGAIDYMRRLQARWLSDEPSSATHDREMCDICRAEMGLTA